MKVLISKIEIARKPKETGGYNNEIEVPERRFVYVRLKDDAASPRNIDVTFDLPAGDVDAMLHVGHEYELLFARKS